MRNFFVKAKKSFVPALNKSCVFYRACYQDNESGPIWNCCNWEAEPTHWGFETEADAFAALEKAKGEYESSTNDECF